ATDPKYLYKRHYSLAGAAVRKCQRRPGGPFPQIASNDLSRVVIILLGPGSAHVGYPVAVFPAMRSLTRGSIEIHPARRNKQCRNSIEQRCFARAGAPHGQEPLLADLDIVQSVERAPVEHLEPRHAELFRRNQDTILSSDSIHSSASSCPSGSVAVRR